jgi:REP element-mobilizing transposase RayT
MAASNFEIFRNPDWLVESEPCHLVTFVKNNKTYLCGWNIEFNLPIVKHSKSVRKLAGERGYKLTTWVKIPDWIMKIR